MTDKEGKRIEHTIHIAFPATNNATEYKEFLARIRMVKIYTDSQLVAGQVGGSFTTKEKNMIKYRETTEEELQKPEEWEIIQVKKEQNVGKDALARLGTVPCKKEGRWKRIKTLKLPSIEPASIYKINIEKD